MVPTSFPSFVHLLSPFPGPQFAQKCVPVHTSLRDIQVYIERSLSRYAENTADSILPCFSHLLFQ